MSIDEAVPAAAGTTAAPDAISIPSIYAPPEPHPHHFPSVAHYHKGLLHDMDGVVLEGPYASFLDALRRPTQAALASISLPPGARKLVDPQAGLATDVQTPAPSNFEMPAPPTLESKVTAAEAVELYWMALLRDVPFARWTGDGGVKRAAHELGSLSGYRGPRAPNGAVTADTLFRGFTNGDLTGPYLSQFLVKELPVWGPATFPYGSQAIAQRQRTVKPGVDYLTDWSTWLEAQNGANFVGQDQFETDRLYIRSMRDLGQYVHVDQLYQAYLNAALMLLALEAPFGEGNPYLSSPTQQGFGTFGGPHVLSLVTEVATRALKAVWYQKWFRWLRLRPEAFGGLVEGVRNRGLTYPVQLHADVLNSKAVAAVEAKYGTALLPMAFPEGSPMHPAYGAGHATVAGACVTILKAFFDEDWIIPEPKVPGASGKALQNWSGAALCVGGELDKLASNISIGRNMAGVHWRSDYTESVKLGERVAIEMLLAQRNDYHEDWYFTFTRFSGQRVHLSRRGLFDYDTGAPQQP